MTLEEFLTLARIIQSLLTPLALVVAAAWAIYTFSALRQVTHSQTTLQKTKEEILDLQRKHQKTEAEILDLQREAKIGAVVEMSIKTSQHIRANDDYTYVLAVVDIENKGNRHTTLPFGEDSKPFSVFPVEHKNGGSLKFGDADAYPVPRARDPNRTLDKNILVRAGGRETIPFYFRVSSPGVYLLVFRVPTSQQEQDLATQFGFNLPGAWVAKEYLVVERPHQNR